MRKFIFTLLAIAFSFAAYAQQQITDKIPAIQDTFFGMKLGTIQSLSTLKSSLWHKGEYLNEQYDSFGRNVTFRKLTFAGKTWDYGDFRLSDKGELYEVSVYDSINDVLASEDVKKEAEQIYANYKEKLDAKYGYRDENSSEDGKYVIYYGENDIVVILSNVRRKSQRGEYRRYVEIDYIQTAINKRLSEKCDDEL